MFCSEGAGFREVCFGLGEEGGVYLRADEQAVDEVEDGVPVLTDDFADAGPFTAPSRP